jgi:hypothetical protein
LRMTWRAQFSKHPCNMLQLPRVDRFCGDSLFLDVGYKWLQYKHVFFGAVTIWQDGHLFVNSTWCSGPPSSCDPQVTSSALGYPPAFDQNISESFWIHGFVWAWGIPPNANGNFRIMNDDDNPGVASVQTLTYKETSPKGGNHGPTALSFTMCHLMHNIAGYPRISGHTFEKHYLSCLCGIILDHD